MQKYEVIIIVHSIQFSCNVSEMWIKTIYINNLPAVWKPWLKLMFSVSWPNLYPAFGTVCSDLSDICLCYWISSSGQRGGKQLMTLKWNSIRSIHIRAMKKTQEFSEFILRTLSQFSSHVRVCLDLPVTYPHLFSFSSRPLLFQGSMLLHIKM